MEKSEIVIKFAETDIEVLASQRLRHSVFVRELGANDIFSDELEVDPFDNHAHHLIAIDQSRPAIDNVLGVYRLMSLADATQSGGFSCEAEFDLSALRHTGRPILELSRSCIHPDYRNGAVMYELWRRLSEFVRAENIEILFGVSSFEGVDLQAHKKSISMLHHEFLAPKDLRPTSNQFNGFEVSPSASIDRKKATQTLPALIKAYLRMGGRIGEGVFVDYPFNTTDVCMVVDVKAANKKQRALYERTSG